MRSEKQFVALSQSVVAKPTEEAKVVFGPLQVGVATQGGAEASVRKLAQEFGDDPGKIMLKVDFSNAFNMVDRTVMLCVSF